MTRSLSFKKRLSLPRTSWQMCLLATLGGAISACLIILFTMSIDAIQLLYMDKRDDYSSLDPLSRFQLPIIGAIVILFFAWITGYKYLRTGIPFVLHRLRVAHGVIPLRNTVHQFFGSAIALGTGFSVGREGPAVHLGAACSSFIGRFFHLPHNSIRTLCACGIAAGISASFNTPIAAVIFVMEVILREYKIHIFIPVMMASIVGSLITSSFYGTAHELAFFDTIALQYHHYPFLVLLGIFLGIVAFFFNRYLVALVKASGKHHIVPRILLAAIITSALGYAVPFAMGTDLSAIGFSLENNMNFHLLAGLLVAKIILTIVALGLGIPGGLVGPILGIGAIAGACASVVVAQYFPSAHIHSDFALVGMAGFMAATLNAPLAALLAVVELSNQLEVVVPAMIVIASASVTSGQFFRNRSAFVMQLEVQKLIYREPPLEKSLQRVGVIGVMNEKFHLLEAEKYKNKDSYQQKRVDNDASYNLIIKTLTDDDSAANVSEPLNNKRSKETNYEYHLLTLTDKAQIEGTSNFVEFLMPAISSQATLAEAYLALNEQRVGGVYIYGKDKNDIIGVVMFEQIRHFLINGKLK